MASLFVDFKTFKTNIVPTMFNIMLAPSKNTQIMNGFEKEKVIIKKVHPIKIHSNPALDLFKIITSLLLEFTINLLIVK
jgi:hypothetical protein